MPSEFELIARHFTRPSRHTALGIGDDAALFQTNPGCQLAVTTDMLVAGTHFLSDTDAEALGWKSLAVNLSDLAAMGATPRWAVLAAALPEPDEAWIAAFARGFFALAQEFDVDVVGGDTTRGPLTLCPTVFGEIPVGQALTRAAGQAGDDVWVSGHPGRAALGLAHLQGRTQLEEARAAEFVQALERPQPRVELGLALRGIAHAAIDVSDGLLADLGHILEHSRLRAEIHLTALPLEDLEGACPDPALARSALLSGGDDYELVFTAPVERRNDVAAISSLLRLPLSRIGSLLPGDTPGVTLLDAAGASVPFDRRGYDHFA